MGHKGSKKDVTNEFKLSKRLTREQRDRYREIGEPDLTQNWLELFTDDVVSDLFTIMNSCSDNQKKADYVDKELRDYGFRYLAEGTNIVVLTNPVYPGVVFKIALDECGIADNFNDGVLYNVVPRYGRIFARHPSAIVSVQQRYITMTSLQMSMYRPRILGLLKELSKHFLVADMSPDRFLNYGIDRDGDFVIQDGSDLYPLHQIKGELRCKRITGQHQKSGEFKYCEGKLEYNDDFSMLVCKKCGREYNPLELRPRKEAAKMQMIMGDGLSGEARDKLEQQEIAAIKGTKWEEPDVKQPVREKSKTIFVHPEDSDEGQDTQDGNDDNDEVEGIEPLKPRVVPMSQIASPTVQPSETEDEPSEEDEDDDEEAEPPIVHVAGNLESSKEPATTDDDGESEGVQDETGHDTEVEDASLDDAVMTALTNAPMDKFTTLKNEHPQVFKIFMEKVIDVAGRDLIMSILGLEDMFPPSDEVESDMSNTVIPEAKKDYDPNEPRIEYQVAYEDESAELPGILVKVSGNFDEAYEKYGLPVYVTVDDGKEYTMAIAASAMKKVLGEAIAEIEEDHAARNRRPSETEDEDDEEDATPEETPSVEEQVMTQGFSAGEEESSEEDDEEDDG